MAVKFTPNYDGVGKMLRSADMQAAMLQRAEKVKAVCEATAPIDVHGHPPGEYAASFRVEVVVEATGRGRDGDVPRAIGRVVNDSGHAAFVEFGNGTEKGRGQFVMNNALDAVNER